MLKEGYQIKVLAVQKCQLLSNKLFLVLIISDKVYSWRAVDGVRFICFFSAIHICNGRKNNNYHNDDGKDNNNHY